MVLTLIQPESTFFFLLILQEWILWDILLAFLGVLVPAILKYMTTVWDEHFQDYSSMCSANSTQCGKYIPGKLERSLLCHICSSYSSIFEFLFEGIKIKSAFRVIREWKSGLAVKNKCCCSTDTWDSHSVLIIKFCSDKANTKSSFTRKKMDCKMICWKTLSPILHKRMSGCNLWC